MNRWQRALWWVERQWFCRVLGQHLVKMTSYPRCVRCRQVVARRRRAGP